MSSKRIKIDIPYIIKNQDRLADIIMQIHYEKSPELKKQYTSRIHKQCIIDILYTFDFLKLAIESGDNNIFIQYIKWLKILLVSYNVPVEVTKLNFKIMLDLLNKEGDLEKSIQEVLQEAIAIIEDTYSNEMYMSTFETNKKICQEYLEYLLKVDRQNACKLILDAYYEKHMSIQEIYLQIIQPVMHEIGRLWQRNMITVSQEHYCSASTQWILARLYPEMFNTCEKEYVYLGACVSKELHEMGGRMVADFFEIEGWDSYYLGSNTPVSGLIQFIKDKKVNVLGLSATMMNHVEEVKNTIAHIRRDQDCNDIKIIVGGYIFNQSPKLYKYVGADGYGRDAQESYDLGCKLVEQNLKLAGGEVC